MKQKKYLISAVLLLSIIEGAMLTFCINRYYAFFIVLSIVGFILHVF